MPYDVRWCIFSHQHLVGAPGTAITSSIKGFRQASLRVCSRESSLQVKLACWYRMPRLPPDGEPRYFWKVLYGKFRVVESQVLHVSTT